MPNHLPAEPNPAHHARMASGAIRALIHATLDPAAIDDPAALASTVAALAEMLERLPQALGQLARVAERFKDDPRLYDDRGAARDASITAMSAGTYLQAGHGLPDHLLHGAAELLSHLGLHDA